MVSVEAMAPDVVMHQVDLCEALDEVRKVNPELAGLLEAISPGISFPLIKAKYRYGSTIMDRGAFCLDPSEMECSEGVAESISDGMGIMALQLSKSCEKFYQMGDRIIPFDVYAPGEMFGLAHALSGLTGHVPHRPTWQISAGARSVFMLPRVTDTRSHKRLNVEFGFSDKPPNTLAEHCSVFRAIDRGTQQEAPWVCELLLFPKQWFEVRNDPDWLRLHNYLLRTAFNKAQESNQSWGQNLIWEQFSATVRMKNLKPGPYMADTLRHILTISSGIMPAYQVIGDEEDTLPVSLIESAYLDVYQLKDYAPVMMQPAKLGKLPVYYSLGYPTLLEGSPTIRKAPSIITELRELKKLIFILQTVLNQLDTVSGPNPQVGYHYFHSEEDPFGEISNSLDIAEIDPVANRLLQGRFAGREFSTYGQFLRGCVGVSLCLSDSG